MTRNFKLTAVLSLLVLVLISSESLYSQQSNFQTSFLAPASIHPVNSGVASTIVEAEHLPYLKEVAKSVTPGFKPTPSDFLIQQAEERFRNGKKAFQDRDYDHARTEFDAAIDVMLTASNKIGRAHV